MFSRRFLPLLLTSLALSPGLASAQITSNWTNPAGGSFTDPLNWSAGVPSANSDTGFLSLASTYNVTFPAAGSGGSVRVTDGDVTFDLQGHTFPVAAVSPQRDTAGTPPKLKIVNGTLNGKGTSVIAVGNLVPAELTIGAGGVLRAENTNSGTLSVAIGEGRGNLTVNSGGKGFFDNLKVAGGNSTGSISQGNVTISGAGSAVEVKNDTYLSQDIGTTSSMTLNGGASFKGSFTYIARHSASTASFVADGPGTTFQSRGLLVGAGGTGTAEFRNGASAVLTAEVPPFAPAALGIGYYNTSNGKLIVRDAGTTISVQGDIGIGMTFPLNAGDKSTGTLEVVGGGPSITAGGKLQMGPTGAGLAPPSLSAVIDSTGLSPVNVGTTAQLQGDMKVTLSKVAPTQGQQFTVLNAPGGISGSLALGGPNASEFALQQSASQLKLVYTAKAGDATGDLLVNFDDLTAMAPNYLLTGTRAQGDLDHDGLVNSDDLLVLARSYESAAPTAGQLSVFSQPFRGDVQQAFASVPEPSLAGAMAVIIASGTLLHRRRHRPGSSQWSSHW
jgi:T5SS/PEP-CTERM-associated repeat protein